MSYCAGTNKATVSVYVSDSIFEKIVSTSPPIDITLVHGQPAQVQGAGLDVANCGQLPNYGIYEYDGFVTFVSINVATPISNPAGFCAGSKPAVNGVTTPGINDVYHSSVQIIRQYSSDWVLSVIDANGKTITRKYPTEPRYEISCNDDCPEGSHKCTHKKYPGYCCVPCKEVGDRLKNMANKVGR
ncbi:hypothetical protein [Nostoc sp. UHCC 0251]|uniref:hypothetical protein n=1 Tax=Nostoc sp. UHCC 0251 TaxID=3110240 RepID=UPI002B2115EF|nr:hypothetical protein [Nostoc sp. UHCC 0251]MEA5624109.1 hypothetical protein [Nostoc sp. UHCC 0251]